MKTCLTPLGIRKIQIKNTVRLYYLPFRMAKIKKNDYISVGEGIGQLDLWSIAGGNTKGATTGHSFTISLAEVPNLRPWTSTGLWPVRNWATQQEVSLNVMHLNHSKTIPPLPNWCVEKLASTESVPGDKRIGDHLCAGQCPNYWATCPGQLHHFLSR